MKDDRAKPLRRTTPAATCALSIIVRLVRKLNTIIIQSIEGGKVMKRLVLALLLLLLPASSASARPIHPGDISLPDGYNIELAVDNLAAPTMVAFDDQGRMLIAESGYDG